VGATRHPLPRAPPRLRPSRGRDRVQPRLGVRAPLPRARAPVGLPDLFKAAPRSRAASLAQNPSQQPRRRRLLTLAGRRRELATPSPCSRREPSSELRRAVRDPMVLFVDVATLRNAEVGSPELLRRAWPPSCAVSAAPVSTPWSSPRARRRSSVIREFSGAP
jgi:hypothetical protein